MAGFCREDILMEDNDILVVHKHAGMAVQNARMGQMDLEHALLAVDGDKVLGLCQRVNDLELLLAGVARNVQHIRAVVDLSLIHI